MPTSLVLFRHLLEESHESLLFHFLVAKTCPSLVFLCRILFCPLAGILLHSLVSEEAAQCLPFFRRLDVFLGLGPFGESSQVCCFRGKAFVAARLSIGG